MRHPKKEKPRFSRPQLPYPEPGPLPTPTDEEMKELRDRIDELERKDLERGLRQVYSDSLKEQQELIDRANGIRPIDRGHGVLWYQGQKL